MAPFLEDNDRQVRERAFRRMYKPYIEQRDALANLSTACTTCASRRQERGHENFRDYAHLEKNRFDYTPDDAFAFTKPWSKRCCPPSKRLQERRRSHLGVDQAPAVGPAGRSQRTDAAAALRRRERLHSPRRDVFSHVQPDFRRDFETMANAGLLDLDNRKGKAPGGFCDSLPVRKLPLIFMNASTWTTMWRTLLQRPGIRFTFSGLRTAFAVERHPGAEMAEVASMSMELLARQHRS